MLIRHRHLCIYYCCALIPIVSGSMSDDSRSNIFARMSDRQDIVDFVKEIEKYQCLYDQNSFQYANKLLKRRTWLDIAKKYKSTVPDCKEKWRKIRIAYMRSLKLGKSGHPPSRPYYLANYLHFISPNKKVDDNLPTTNCAPSPTPSDISLKLEIDEYDHLADSNDNVNDRDDMRLADAEKHEEWRSGRVRRDVADQRGSADRNLSSTDKTENRFYEEPNGRPGETVGRSNDRGRIEIDQSCLVDENNPRRMFLMSLLPDIESLNKQEMRTFRREVIALLDRIMSTRDTVIMNLSR